MLQPILIMRSWHFKNAILGLDTQRAWVILNVLIDKFLQHRVGQLELPPKGDFKDPDP